MKARIIKQQHALSDDGDDFVKELPVMTPKEQEEHKEHEEFLSKMPSLEIMARGTAKDCLVLDKAVQLLTGTPAIGVDLANDQDTVVVTKTDGNSIFGFDNHCFVPRGNERYF